MNLKPFISNANTWRKHFEDSYKPGYNRQKKFHTIQEGSGFPLNNIVSVSPTKQAEEIAKSEIIKINKSANQSKRKYNRKSKPKSSQTKPNARRGKVNSSKKKTLSHKKKTLSRKRSK